MNRRSFFGLLAVWGLFPKKVAGPSYQRIFFDELTLSDRELQDAYVVVGHAKRAGYRIPRPSIVRIRWKAGRPNTIWENWIEIR